MRKLDVAASILMFIGAINWGLIGLFGVNIVDFFLENEKADRFIFALVGVAALYKLVYWRAIRNRWRDWKTD